MYLAPYLPGPWVPTPAPATPPPVQNSGPAPAPPPQAGSASGDFVERAQERLHERWARELEPPRTRTLADLDPKILAEVRSRMRVVGPESAAFQGLAKMLAAEGFGGLSPDLQRVMLDAVQGQPNDAAKHTLLRRLLAYPSFLALEPAAQREVVRSFERLPNAELERTFDALKATDAAGQARVLKLVGSPELRELDAKSRGRWLDGLAHADEGTRRQTHERLEETCAGPFYEHGDREARSDLLHRAAAALDRPYGAPETRERLPGASRDEPVITRDRRTKEADLFADGKKHPAERYVVEIEGQKIEVFVAKDRDPGSGHFKSVEDVAQMLAGLPETLRRQVDQVVLEPDNTLKEKGDAPNMFAGLSKDKGRIFVFPTADASSQAADTATLSHESGHLLATRAWVADRKKADAWKAAIYADDTAPSFYATRSLQEDVAETIQLYYQVKGTAAEADLKKQMPHRYALVRELLGE